MCNTKNNFNFTNNKNNNVSDYFSYDVYDSDKSDEFNANNNFYNNNKKQKNLEINFENKKIFNDKNVNITMTNDNGLNKNNNNELIIYNKKINKQILEKSLGNKVFEEKDDRRNSSDKEIFNKENTFTIMDSSNIRNSSIEIFLFNNQNLNSNSSVNKKKVYLKKNIIKNINNDLNVNKNFIERSSEISLENKTTDISNTIIDLLQH
jgi:hypothetical protein